MTTQPQLLRPAAGRPALALAVLVGALALGTPTVGAQDGGFECDAACQAELDLSVSGAGESGFDPTGPITDATAPISVADTDGDSLLDDTERFEYGTDPYLADTDGDSITDDVEINLYGTNPLAFDTDGDNLGDNDEFRYGASPFLKDSDGDCLWDGDEVALGTRPTELDSDGDGGFDGTDDEPLSPPPIPVSWVNQCLDADGDGYGIIHG